ncbi:MAG: molybdenum cofactor biosynthesis protein, partial [Gammaproteobacteria bacterium]|nr:molybdenum cofactor biosynthesis protein [Gammaproteobacteria bacterium]
MTGHFDNAGFVPLNIAILTISDSRTEADDKSGKLLQDGAESDGHNVVEKAIVKDDIYQMRAIFSRWIADPKVHVIISTGGTGITGRDSTPEAVAPLLEKPIEG